MNNKNYGKGLKCKSLENWKSDNRKRYKERSQDPFWYAKSQEQINRIANLTWNEVVGARLPFAKDDIIPAMVTIPYKRTMGSTFTDENYDALTRAADSYFQYMTQGFTGAVEGFEAADLLMTGAAGASLMADMTELKRAFGMLNMFTDQNSYYARKMFRALGFDYDSFTVDHSKADFCSDFNILVDQINDIILVPKGMMCDERWTYLSEFIFSDNNDPEFNTLMAYTCKGSLLYKAVDWSTGTALQWDDFFTDDSGQPMPNGLTYEQAFRNINKRINLLIDHDVREMFGALRRVYSEDHFVKLAHVEETFETQIVRNDIVAAAIHNGTYFERVGTQYDTNSATLTTGGSAGFDGIGYPAIQNGKGRILSRIFGRNIMDNAVSTFSAFQAPSIPTYIDLYGHDITPGNVLDVTAQKAAFIDIATDGTVDGDEGSYGAQGISVRSEVFLYPELWFNEYDEDNEAEFKSKIIVPYIMNDNVDTSLIDWFAMLSHVNSHPLIQIIKLSPAPVVTSEDGEDRGVECSKLFGEIDTYNRLNNNTLSTMHAKAIVQLFALPKSNKSVTN